MSICENAEEEDGNDGLLFPMLFGCDTALIFFVGGCP
jgi:hypothetical protein